MEGCVEYAYLGQTGHEFLHGIHTLQVCRIVQRSQVRTLLKSLQHLVGQDDGLVELLAAVHHAVAYGINLVKALDDTDFRVGQQGEDELHTLGMFGDVVHDLLLLAVSQLHFHKGTVQAHTLSATRCHHTLVVHVVQGILNRGRTTI